MKKRILIPLIAGLALLCACKGKGSSNEMGDSSTMITNSTKGFSKSADTIQSHPKLVKTADMRFEVKNVQQATEKITALTASYNGAVIHHLMKSISGDSVAIRKSNDSIMQVTIINSSAEMTIKIPPVNMESFITQVAHLGINVKSLRMDVSDKTLDYLSTSLKLKNQNELVDQQKKETAGKKDPDNLLAFKNNMIDQQINSSKIDDSVKNSIITLNFYESNIISSEIIANDDLSAYNLPFSKRLGLAIENGWGVFVDIFVGIANFWVLIPIGLGVWFIIRYYKSKVLAKG